MKVECETATKENTPRNFLEKKTLIIFVTPAAWCNYFSEWVVPCKCWMQTSSLVVVFVLHHGTRETSYLVAAKGDTLSVDTTMYLK